VSFSIGALEDAVRAETMRRVGAGLLSRRWLAQQPVMSQPQMQNWLAGRRGLSVSSLDAVMVALLVRRDGASRHDAMHVRVKQQVLSPAVQDAEKADCGPQMNGVGRDLQQGIRTGLKQQTVDLLLVCRASGDNSWGKVNTTWK